MVVGAAIFASVTRNLAQSFIQSGVFRGLSANAIQRSLIAVGLGYRRTNILSDVKFWKAGYAKSQLMKYTPRGYKLGADKYIETPWKISARYETVIKATLRNPETGELSDRIVTVAHTHLEEGVETSDLLESLTREEIEETAKGYLSLYPEGRGAELVNIMPVLGYHNPKVG